MYVAGIGQRYATALADFAAQNGEEDLVYARTQTLLGAWRNVAFRERLTSPVISAEAKREMVAALFGGAECATMARFVELVISRRRERFLDIMLHAYVSLYKERHRMADAVVTSAAELDAPFRERLRRLIESHTACSVTIDWRTDPALLGGFVVRIDDVEVDASLARQVEKLQYLMA